MMDQHDAPPDLPHDAIPVRDPDLPYEGLPGQTRHECVHLVESDGTLRSVAVCRGINARTHPELKARALAGLLHRLEDGRELALSFVYHDPDARKFALVIPTGLAHLELKEWSKLMAEIAEDTLHAVPMYVRDMTTVLGVAALTRFLDSEPELVSAPFSPPADNVRSLELEARAKQLAERERELEHQEAALMRMAESLTAREVEWNRQRALSEARAVDVRTHADEDWPTPPTGDHDATVVSDLPRRVAGETAVAVTPSRVPPPLPAARHRPPSRPPPLPHRGKQPPPLTPRQRDIGILGEQLTHLGRGVAPPPLPSEAGRSSTLLPHEPGRGSASAHMFAGTEGRAVESAQHFRASAERGSASVRMFGESEGGGSASAELFGESEGRGSVSAHVFRDSERHGSQPQQFGESEGHDSSAQLFGQPGSASAPPPLPSEALVEPDPEPEVAPPEPFLKQHPGEMSYKLAEDELWLFVHLDQDHETAFRNAADFMVQYVEVEGYPVVVLALVDQREPTYAVRLALDGREKTDLLVLEHLRRSCRARVALYVDALYVETVTVATMRESVAQAITDRLAKLPAAGARVAAEDAIPRVLEVPPPLWNSDLPFGPARREAPTTVTVLAAVDQLAAWLRPEKLNEATLTYSVPRHVIDATIERVVRAALAFGVALPDELIALAVDHGVAPDEAAVVRDLLAAFRQRVDARQNDLGVEATRKNWDRLFAAADARQVFADEATQVLARAQPPAPPSEPQVARPFETATAAELRHKLHDPAARIEAIRELCIRGHTSAIDPVFNVLDALRPEEAAIAVAQLLSFGDAAGDSLIAALASPSEAVRQCAALALGKLQLRRALVPLLNQLEIEDSSAYAEIARAFGDFGAPALRSVVRVLPTSESQDRLVLALAHLANHGSAREVERLENDSDPSVSQSARKAMARRARMEWEDLSVREQRTLPDASPAARLSQVFYAEASKVAI